MISRSYIESNLKRMNHKFIRARSNKEALFFSKMAIIELCGWIEETMDNIIIRCANRNLTDAKNKEYVENEIVKQTYGFHYDRNFQKMLVGIIGIIMCEKLEKTLDAIKFQKMKSELGSLTQMRNKEAHTHLKSQHTINAPSVTIRQYKAIYEGLIDIEKNLKKLKYLK